MRKNWNKKSIKKALIKAYKENNYRTLSVNEIKNNIDLPSRMTIYKFYKKRIKDVWEEISCEENIILNYRKSKNSKNKISNQIIIERVQLLAKKLKRNPTFKEYKNLYGFNQIPYKFGGYKELLIKAGLLDKSKGNISKIEMIKYLQNKIDDGKIKSNKDLRLKKEFPTLEYIFKVLECNSLEEINKIINRNIFCSHKYKEKNKSIKGKLSLDLLNEYILLSEKIKKENGATGTDIEKYLGYSKSSFIGRFITLKNLRNLAGYSHPKISSKWNKKIIKAILLKEYKENNYKELKSSEIDTNEMLPSSVTVKRHFNKKDIDSIWKEILF